MYSLLTIRKIGDKVHIEKDNTYYLGIYRILISQHLVQISMGKNFLTTKSCFKICLEESLFVIVPTELVNLSPFSSPSTIQDIL